MEIRVAAQKSFRYKLTKPRNNLTAFVSETETEHKVVDYSSHERSSPMFLGIERFRMVTIET